jgi:hypothetical protein
MVERLRDIGFSEFDWPWAGTGDFAVVEGATSFRDLVNRWLLTVPGIDEPDLGGEEVETRRRFEDAAAREADYSAPNGDRMTACLAWDPTWGLGIKRYAGRVLTPAVVAEVESRVRTGLAALQGVRRVVSVSASGVGNSLRIGWAVETVEWGMISDSVEVE